VIEVDIPEYPAIDRDPIDWNFFTLSTAPIRKLTIPQNLIYDKPAEFLSSVFTSLVHLYIYMKPGLDIMDVRKPFF
jgi:hypothetical protein